MNYSSFNFSQIIWLWSLVAIPSLALLYVIFYKPSGGLERLKHFADTHLLPHLIKNRDAAKKSVIAPLVLWSLILACGSLAMAGPRWGYTDVQANKPERNMVILLDLSKSMDAEDVKPSRLVRAREEIEDILGANHKLNVGLVAFAAVPHMVVPLTDDMSTIRNLLPYLDTKLISIQGTRLKPALEMAARMLNGATGHDKSILIVSDGGFEDTAAAREILSKDIAVYTLGIGTTEGAPIPADHGDFIKDRDGHMVVAKLEEGKLQALADAGHGLYVTADYTGNDAHAILSRLESGIGEKNDAGKIVRVWDEKFWIPALVMASFMLLLFRKGYIYSVLLFFIVTAMPFNPAHAEWIDVFRNSDQQAEEAFNKGDYNSAANMFDTPYRRGVAQYKAKQYGEAAKSFGEVTDPDRRLDAEYNLGNAQLMESKPEAAIATYETYLKEKPNDEAAQHNLAVAKKLLEEQKKQQQASNQSQSQKERDQGGDNQQEQQQAATDQKQDEKNGSNRQQNGNEESGKEQDKPQNKPDSAQAAQENNGDNKQQSQQNQSKKIAPQKEQAQATEPQRAKSDSQTQQTENHSSKDQATQSQSSQPNELTNKPQFPSDDDRSSSQGNEFPIQQTHARTQQDVDADQWLSHVESDPGAFLKNQFLIEARKSGAQPEDEPW